jgi:hypothetical protein
VFVGIVAVLVVVVTGFVADVVVLVSFVVVVDGVVVGSVKLSQDLIIPSIFQHRSKKYLNQNEFYFREIYC